MDKVPTPQPDDAIELDRDEHTDLTRWSPARGDDGGWISGPMGDAHEMFADQATYADVYTAAYGRIRAAAHAEYDRTPDETLARIREIVDAAEAEIAKRNAEYAAADRDAQGGEVE